MEPVPGMLCGAWVMVRRMDVVDCEGLAETDPGAAETAAKTSGASRIAAVNNAGSSSRERRMRIIELLGSGRRAGFYVESALEDDSRPLSSISGNGIRRRHRSSRP